VEDSNGDDDDDDDDNDDEKSHQLSFGSQFAFA